MTLPGAEEQCVVPFGLLFDMSLFISGALPLVLEMVRAPQCSVEQVKVAVALTELGRTISGQLSAVAAIEQARNSSATKNN